VLPRLLAGKVLTATRITVSLLGLSIAVNMALAWRSARSAHMPKLFIKKVAWH